MASPIVVVLVVVGFLAGLASGSFAAYHVLATLGHIQGAIHEVAQRAGPF
jgi:Tfp pilus assembly protein PilE